MSFDGVTVAALVAELNQTLTGGHISRISQPEKDELLFLIRTSAGNHRLHISVNASVPLASLTEKNISSPLTAPAFCMLLRKKLINGVIKDIYQIGLDRILVIEAEHRNELGDMEGIRLITELMGKHSNIILTDKNDLIIDSIKRISANLSSVREVLPGRTYFKVNTRDQVDTLNLTVEIFKERILSRPESLSKVLNTVLSGIGPLMSEELCYRAGLVSDIHASSLSDADGSILFKTVMNFAEDIKNKKFFPSIVFDGQTPVEFSAVNMKLFEGRKTVDFTSVSSLLEFYYAEKAASVRVRQKSQDLRKLVQIRLERACKKADFQRKQLEDTKKRDEYRIYGEMLNTYGYELKGGEKTFRCENYYTSEEIEIPLDPTLNAKDNAIKYFARYTKLKRTKEAVSKQLTQTEAEIEHLLSVQASIDVSETEEDIHQIRQELVEAGFLKKLQGGTKKYHKRQERSGPLHFVTEDGFNIYVGKNNYQNEEVTFKIASGADWWFHAKQSAGSHVIAKTDGRELSDDAFISAASLAAYFSSARKNDKVEVDYVKRNELKKVPHARPGYVIFYKNYSMVVKPEISGKLTQVE